MEKIKELENKIIEIDNKLNEIEKHFHCKNCHNVIKFEQRWNDDDFDDVEIEREGEKEIEIIYKYYKCWRCSHFNIIKRQRHNCSIEEIFEIKCARLKDVFKLIQSVDIEK